MSATEYRDPDSVEDELWNVAEQTRSSGRVRAKVTTISNIDDEIHVTYQLPNGNTTAHEFDFPKRDHREYELVRFLDAYGLSLNSVDNLPDTLVECEVVDDEYRLFVPPLPQRDRLRGWTTLKKLQWGLYVSGGFVFLPFSGLVWTLTEWVDEGDPAAAFVVSVIGTLLWIIILLSFGVVISIVF